MHRPIKCSINIVENCEKEGVLAQLDERVTQIEHRCDKKEARIERLMLWQAGAHGYAVGLASSGGLIGALIAFIFNHYFNK